MPRAIFTSVGREELGNADVLKAGKQNKRSKAEDQFKFGGCLVTCRYRIKGGDVVSSQILGCFNAINVGNLRCKRKKLALQRVSESRTAIGINGPDEEVNKLATSIGKQVLGVIVTETEAIVAE